MVSVPSTPALPNCSLCGVRGEALTRLITRHSNRNGNAGRPCLKCMKCQQFVTFTDNRGTSPAHGSCNCNVPSRLQVAGRAQGRGLHYVCATGICDFYALGIDRSGEQVALAEDLVQAFADLGLI